MVIKNKKFMYAFLIIGIISLTLGVTISFFNYTRTGGANNVAVGRIRFNTTQDGNISLTNIFPISIDDVDDYNVPNNNVTINIEGDTTYNEGIEYLVTAEDVNITINEKRIPVNLKVSSTTDLGTNDPDYFTNRGGETSRYKVLSGGVVVPGQYLLVGYIGKGQTGIDGNLTIKAFIDKDKIAISDTYDETESDNMGTTNDWVRGRTVFTTEEWNSLSGNNNGLSFKIRVEANEGIWVDEASTPNLMNAININRNGANITEIRFIQETPLRMERRYANSPGVESNGTKGDLTYQDTGKVLAWIEEKNANLSGLNNTLNTKPSFLINEENKPQIELLDNNPEYILYIASSGDTKWVTGSGLFTGFTNVKKITFENVDTSDVTAMNNMFISLSKLTSIDLSNMGSNNLTNITSMFSGCTNIEEIVMKNFNFGSASMRGLFASLTKLSSVNLQNANTSNVTNMSGMFSGCTSLTSIDLSNAGGNNLSNISGIFGSCTNLEEVNMSSFNFGSASMSGLFASLTKLSFVNLQNTNTLNVTNMSGMFSGCTDLISVDLSNLGGNNLSNISGIFGNCTNLEEVNMSSFHFGTASMFALFINLTKLNTVNLQNVITANVTSMSSLFYGCSGLKKVDLSNLGSNNLINISDMFKNCTNLEEVNMGGFNFGTASMSGLFVNLTKLSSVNLKNANTSNVTNMNSLFNGCSCLINVDLSNTGGNNLTNLGSMFNGCTNIEEINMSGFNFGTAIMRGLFVNLTKLSFVNLQDANTSNVTNMAELFYGCTSLVNVDISGLGGNNLTDTSNMFSGCTNLETINMSNFNFGAITALGRENSGFYTNYSPFTDAPKIKNINLSNAKASNATTMNRMFYNHDYLVSVNLSGFDSSNVTDMSEMFYHCVNLKNLILDGFDTSSVVNINNIFEYCSNITNIDLSSLDFSSIRNMNTMFRYCSSLKSINLSHLGSNTLVSMEDIFYECLALENVDMSYFNFGTITSLGNNSSFRGLSGLKTVNLSNANASSVINISEMFSNCTSLISVDLCGINMPNITSSYYMFSNCSKLKTIYVSSTWNLSNINVSYDMFSGCTSLVGGNGTVYDSTKVDATMAVIDTPSTPGYLTLKTV